MLTYTQSLAIVLLSITFALALLYLLDCKLEEGTRKRANSVNGWQLSILGTVYAVSLGFMLSDAWLAYQAAVADVRAEASAVLLINRSAQLMPEACSQPLQQQSRAYLDAVIGTEWTAMQAHHANASGETVLRQMWNTLGSCAGHEATTGRGNVITALSSLQIRRDARMQDFQGHLPFMMWNVLIFGGVIVVISSCLLCNERKSIHFFHVISLTVLITVSLLAISDLDRPFEGATHVDVGAFRAVQNDLQDGSAR
ncbi:DUF4239 domain-containing protein [Terriglobus sp. TAA 43]|uniref:bestrophin-like domain n=1 Tax=Terriglobus sp. TAA 43 TaxID=278961 RepID=UPI00064813CE|nr:DUF4239 domain-containing protein [Terriglobus sp. TAA 43]